MLCIMRWIKNCLHAEVNIFIIYKDYLLLNIIGYTFFIYENIDWIHISLILCVIMKLLF